MNLKYPLEAVDMGEEIIMVPVGEGAGKIRGVIKLNRSGYKILNLLNSGKSKEEVVALLSAEYENSKEVLEEYVHSVVEAFQTNDFLS